MTFDRFADAGAWFLSILTMGYRIIVGGSSMALSAAVVAGAGSGADTGAGLSVGLAFPDRWARGRRPAPREASCAPVPLPPRHRGSLHSRPNRSAKSGSRGHGTARSCRAALLEASCQTTGCLPCREKQHRIRAVARRQPWQAPPELLQTAGPCAPSPLHVIGGNRPQAPFKVKFGPFR